MTASKPIDLGALGARAAVLAPARSFPTSFLSFCSWLGVTLTPGQRVLCAVAYDNVEPKDLPPEDRELARLIFGAVDVIPPAARGTLAIVAGGRSGKSYVAIALRMVYGALTRDLKSLAPGQKAVALIIAANAKLRNEVISYALGACRSHPSLASMLHLAKGKKQEDAADSFGIRRPDGHLVMVEAGVAARGGYGGRGRSLTDFAMDEAAFMRDSGFQACDADVYTAAAPRVLPGGISIVASTPWAESGLLFDFYQKNYGNPKAALVAHAPTLLMQNNKFTQDIVFREKQRDPDNAAREFDAEFMRSGTTAFFTVSEIDASIDLSLDCNP